MILNKELDTRKRIEKIEISIDDIDSLIEDVSNQIRGHSLVPVLEEQRRALINAGKYEIEVSKLQHWLIESKYGVHAASAYLVAVSLIIITISSLLQIYSPIEGWFQRGGAVVVCAAVYFAYKNYSEELKLFTIFTPAYRNAYEMMIDHQNNQRKGYAQHGSSAEIQSLRAKTDRGLESIFARMNSMKVQRLVRNTLIVETSVLILGTIIWGYGDLLI